MGSKAPGFLDIDLGAVIATKIIDASREVCRSRFLKSNAQIARPQLAVFSQRVRTAFPSHLSSFDDQVM